MSTDTLLPEVDEATARRWFEGRNLTILLGLIAIVVVSIVRLIADADRLTASTTIVA